MSHVNRNDRLSRRLLGFTGSVESVQAQNRALAERVKVLEAEVKGANAVVLDMASRLNAIEAHPALLVPSLTAVPSVEPVPTEPAYVCPPSHEDE